jgi:hypothetical protein
VIVDDHDPKPLVQLAYSTPDRDFRPAAQAIKLTFWFAFDAVPAILVVSPIFGICFFGSPVEGGIVFTALGILDLGLCSILMFLGGWRRWRTESGSLKAREPLWPAAVLYVVVVYALLALFFPFAWMDKPESMWLMILWGSAMLIWPVWFGWSSRNFLLVRAAT